jgi:hypothetical protein
MADRGTHADESDTRALRRRVAPLARDGDTTNTGSDEAAQPRTPTRRHEPRTIGSGASDGAGLNGPGDADGSQLQGPMTPPA